MWDRLLAYLTLHDKVPCFVPYLSPKASRLNGTVARIQFSSNLALEKEHLSKSLFTDVTIFVQTLLYNKALDSSNLIHWRHSSCSTHPNSEFLFDIILSSYKSTMKDKKKECDEILKKFDEVRMRGRKRTMVGWSRKNYFVFENFFVRLLSVPK